MVEFEDLSEIVSNLFDNCEEKVSDNGVVTYTYTSRPIPLTACSLVASIRFVYCIRCWVKTDFITRRCPFCFESVQHKSDLTYDLP